jgi:predicted Rossmann fold nucleotide-binding protein DprA/Smf involved in DNA uptake
MRHTRGKLKTNDMRAVKSIDRSDARYPAVLRKYLGIQAPDCFFGLGDLAILRQKKLALFCSVKCPGNMILQAYDLARQLRDEGIVVISGFHSSMEKECLSLLLRGKQPVIWCPARRLPAKKLRKEYAGPISDGRLLMLSPFGERIKRARQDIARFRNEFVAALADQVFIVYATPGGKTESFCKKVLGWGKPLLTFNSPSNAALLASGARPYTGLDAFISERS